MSDIHHFLLVFDHASDRLLEQVDFKDNAEAATEAYGEREERYRGASAIDIVLVGSDSLETVKTTHGTYFSGFAQKQRQELMGRLQYSG